MPAHHEIEALPWDTIAAEYQDRWRPVADICRAWRISKQCLKNRMRRAGVQLRRHGGFGCRPVFDRAPRPCSVCGREFTPVNLNVRSCSPSCGAVRAAATRKRKLEEVK